MKKNYNVFVGYLLNEDDNMERVLELTKKLNNSCDNTKTLDVLCASAFLFTAALNQLSQNPKFNKGDEKLFIDGFPEMVEVLYKFIDKL